MQNKMNAWAPQIIGEVSTLNSRNLMRKQLASPPQTVKHNHTKNIGLRIDTTFTKRRNTGINKNVNNYMIRFKNRISPVKSPKQNENRDLTFEPSSDENSDLGDSCGGFSPGIARYTINNTPIKMVSSPTKNHKASDAVKMLNIAKRDIMKRKLYADILHLPPI